MSLRGLSLFIKYYFTSKTPTKESGDKASANKPQLDKLEKIFNDPKFWKFSKDQSMKVITKKVKSNLKNENNKIFIHKKRFGSSFSTC